MRVVVVRNDSRHGRGRVTIALIYSSTIASIVLLGTWAGNFHHFKVRNNVAAAKGATTTRLLNPHVLPPPIVAADASVS
jgi:hypothetical protein